MLDCRLNDFFDRRGHEMQLNFTRFESCHLSGFLDQMIQAVTFFINYREQFAALGWIRGRWGEEAGHRSFDGGEWCAKVVRDGIEQGGLEALALALGFGLAELLDGPGPLDGDGDEAADGVQSLA